MAPKITDILKGTKARDGVAARFKDYERYFGEAAPKRETGALSPMSPITTL